MKRFEDPQNTLWLLILFAPIILEGLPIRRQQEEWPLFCTFYLVAGLLHTCTYVISQLRHVFLNSMFRDEQDSSFQFTCVPLCRLLLCKKKRKRKKKINTLIKITSHGGFYSFQKRNNKTHVFFTFLT